VPVTFWISPLLAGGLGLTQAVATAGTNPFAIDVLDAINVENPTILALMDKQVKAKMPMRDRDKRKVVIRVHPLF